MKILNYGTNSLENLEAVATLLLTKIRFIKLLLSSIADTAGGVIVQNEVVHF